jgi:hypothetical protein
VRRCVKLSLLEVYEPLISRGWLDDWAIAQAVVARGRGAQNWTLNTRGDWARYLRNSLKAERVHPLEAPAVQRVLALAARVTNPDWQELTGGAR